MTISLAQVYNSLRCHAIFKFSADQLLVNFQSITDSGSFFRRISVCFLLTQNLNYFGKAFFKDPMRVLLLALVESIYLIVFVYIAIYGIVSEQSTRIRSLRADFEKTLNEKNQVFF